MFTPSFVQCEDFPSFLLGSFISSAFTSKPMACEYHTKVRLQWKESERLTTPQAHSCLIVTCAPQHTIVLSVRILLNMKNKEQRERWIDKDTDAFLLEERKRGWNTGSKLQHFDVGPLQKYGQDMNAKWLCTFRTEWGVLEWKIVKGNISLEKHMNVVSVHDKPWISEFEINLHPRCANALTAA